MKLSAFFAGPRHIFATAALVASMILAGGAAQATEWRGGGYIADFRGCEDHGWMPGQNQAVMSRYRPARVGTNNNQSRLTFLFANGAEHYQTERGPFRPRFRPVIGAGIWSSAWEFQPAPRLRLMQQQPANIDENTDTIRLHGRIRHFGGLRGCNMRFELILNRQ